MGEKLTKPQITALTKPWLATRSVGRALVRRGLLSSASGDFFITDAGHTALAAIEREGKNG